MTTAPLGKEEIKQVIKTLKSGKASGQDNLNAEHFKSRLAAEMLQTLFTATWEGKQLPNDWIGSVIVKILKKGTLSICNNMQGITLWSVPSKILAKIIIQRQIKEPGRL